MNEADSLLSGGSTLDPPLPQLLVELEQDYNLISAKNRCGIFVTIRRRDDGGGDCRSCIFDWHPIYYQLFLAGIWFLCHDTALDDGDSDDGDLVPVQLNGDPLPLADGVVGCQTLWELAPGGQIQVQADIDHVYVNAMTTGETYALVWDGCNVNKWDWGSIRDHAGQKMPYQKTSIYLDDARLVIYIHENVPASPQPVEVLQEEREVPKLRMTLMCSKKAMPPDGINPTTVSITYEAPPGSRPITFHTSEFRAGRPFLVYRRRGGAWELHITDFVPPFYYNTPRVKICVGQHQDFVSLQPGETWTDTHNISRELLPDARKSGDELCYQFAGGEVDWWDWGSKDEHANTIVATTGYGVLEPEDNDGRPKLIVPPSNAAYFCIE